MRTRNAFLLGAASGAALLGVVWRLSWLDNLGLDVDWPTTLQAAANVAQVVAVVVGGIWTYRLFIKQRLDRTRAEVTVSVGLASRVGQQNYLRVTIQIQNVGTIALEPKSASISIRAIKRTNHPLEFPQLRGAPLPNADSPHAWPNVADAAVDLQKKGEELTLEPGESERYPFDFALPNDLEILQVHATVRESQDADADYWDDTVVYALPAQGVP